MDGEEKVGVLASWVTVFFKKQETKQLQTIGQAPPKSSQSISA